jgi:hypothetical protein
MPGQANCPFKCGIILQIEDIICHLKEKCLRKYLYDDSYKIIEKSIKK